MRCVRFIIPIAVVAAVAFGAPPSPETSRPASWRDVPTSDRAFFEHYATMLRRGPDGSVWCVKVALEVERLRPHTLKSESLAERFDQYARDDAPVYYNLVTGARYQNENDVEAAIQTTMEDARRRVREAKIRAILDQTPGAYITALKVHQVLPDGLLVSFPASSDTRQVFLTGFALERAVVDDDVLAVSMKVRPAGRKQYTSVLGAVRTVEWYEVAQEYDWNQLVPPDPPLRVALEPISAEQLFNLTQAGVVEEIPVWSLRRETVQARVPSRTSRGLSGVQSGSYSRRTKGRPAVYRWEWEVEKISVPLYRPGP